MQTIFTKSLLLTALLSTLAGIPQAQAVTRGFFAAKPVPGATEEFAKKILTADFNNDGKPDFATLHWEIDDNCKVRGVNCGRGFFVEVYLNTTPMGARDASFQFASELPYTPGEWRFYPVWDNDMLIADVNGDDITDIVAANAHNDVILTFLGIADPITKKGTGQFNAPVETVVDDDPTYITAGYFATSSGLKQLYVQNYFRNAWACGYYNILSSMYQFNPNGSLTKIGNTVDDTTGEWDFSEGPYYISPRNMFTTTVPKESVVFPSKTQPIDLETDGKDLVMQNVGRPNPLWLHFVRRGNLTGRYYPDAIFPLQFIAQRNCLKQGEGPCNLNLHEAVFYSATQYAFNGGSFIKTLDTKNNKWNEVEYDHSLDAFISDHILSFSSLNSLNVGYYGAAILLDDLDRDEQTDIIVMSDDVFSGARNKADLEKPHNTEQSILVAYGNNSVVNNTAQHPLNVDSSKGFDTDRIKMLTNASGRWSKGLHDWHWALGDFNGDGYNDLITVTDNGIMVHTNYGDFGEDAIPPVLTEMRPSNGIVKSNGNVTLFGNFRTGDRLANWVELTDIRTQAKYLLAADPTLIPKQITDPVTQLTVTIPADIIKPGTYELRATNTLARSNNLLRLIVL